MFVAFDIHFGRTFIFLLILVVVLFLLFAVDFLHFASNVLVFGGLNDDFVAFLGALDFHLGEMGDMCDADFVGGLEDDLMAVFGDLAEILGCMLVDVPSLLWELLARRSCKD